MESWMKSQVDAQKMPLAGCAQLIDQITQLPDFTYTESITM